MDIEVIFNPPKNLGVEKIKKVFLQILKEIEPIIRLPKKSMLKAVSIREKIKSISDKVMHGIKLNFNELISDSKNKTDVIVTFLGVLELVKQKTVVVKQDNKFGDIVVEKI